MNDAFYIKLRAFGLSALYVSLAMFALLLTLAAFKFWPFADGPMHHLSVVGTAFVGLLAAISNGRAAHRIINALNHQQTMPPIEFIPFMLMSMCLIIASWLLLGIDRV